MKLFTMMPPPMLALLLMACSNAGSSPVSEKSEPLSCTSIGSGIERQWERLGSPISPFADGHLSPSLIVEADELWLYYSQRDNLNDTLYRIASDDGITWTTPVPLTGLDELGNIKQLSVSQGSNEFRGIVGGGRIGLASSEDGLQWTLDEIQIIDPGDFDIYGQTHPVFSQNNQRMWYSGFSGVTYAIGMAEATEMGWENRGPVIESDPTARYENAAVAQSAILESEAGIEMWYGGYDTSQTDPGPWRILSAWSTDGKTWTKQGVALDLLESGEEAWSVREPSLIQWQNQLWMAYIAMGDDSIYRLKMARCVGVESMF